MNGDLTTPNQRSYKKYWIAGVLLISPIACYLFTTLPTYLILDLPFSGSFTEEIVRHEYIEWENIYSVWRMGCYGCLVESDQRLTELSSWLLENGWQIDADNLKDYDCIERMAESHFLQADTAQFTSYVLASGEGSVDNRFPRVCVVMWSSESNYSFIIQTVNVGRWAALFN